MIGAPASQLFGMTHYLLRGFRVGEQFSGTASIRSLTSYARQTHRSPRPPELRLPEYFGK
jgi:hypothetical protein